jgi:phosphoribosylaminoimidazolecarboxamide formyltransferase/IMP cyclohydrolase
MLTLLHPFHRSCVENIDIGGPAMIRSASKNHASVAVVTDAAQYAAVIAELNTNAGALGVAHRKRLAAAAFALTASYDTAISTWMAQAIAQ